MTKRFFARISITFVNSSVGTSGRAQQKSTVTPAVDFCLYSSSLKMHVAKISGIKSIARIIVQDSLNLLYSECCFCSNDNLY